MSEQQTIEYYSDVLCVWAWIAERRNEQLRASYGDQVTLKTRYLELFSDTATRIGKGWAERGSYGGFCQHVLKSAEPYEEAPIHPEIWKKCQPSTSANAHLVIKASELVGDEQTATRLARNLRERFFVHAEDIGRLDLVLSAASELGLPIGEMRTVIDSGVPIANLLADNKSALSQHIQGSPSWVMNSGRQILYGNVGYRVLQANVEELIRSPAHEASWC